MNVKRDKPKVVAGLADPAEIADGFATYFTTTCKPNSAAKHDQLRNEYIKKCVNYCGNYLHPDDFFTVELLSIIVSNLKTGRAAGFDGLTAEHLIHSHPAALLLITYMCNLILLSGYVPLEFGIGVTFPIPKCSSWKKTVGFDDFRGITVSPVISKILEKCILANFGNYFWSADNQFGFKQSIGCSHAVYCLRSVCDYFLNNSSSMFVCSLDVSKAFDKISHFALYSKLMNRHVPVNIIKILYNWYCNSFSSVSWNGVFSGMYTLEAGIRQGGALSPVLFAVYVNSLLEKLQNTGLGCHIGMIFTGAFMYADDLVLVSASISDLQSMIDVCIDELNSLDMKINAKKSSCIRFGKGYKTDCAQVSVDGISLPWSPNLKYLGITLKSSSKFSVDLKDSRSNFYKSFNAIYSKVSRANEDVILSLVKSFCIPSLMYGIEALHLNASDLNSLDTPMFQALYKIFKTYDKVTASYCMFFMNILPPRFEYIFRKLKFLVKNCNSVNTLVSFLCNRHGSIELELLHKQTNVEINDGFFKIKNNIFKLFERSLNQM